MIIGARCEKCGQIVLNDNKDDTTVFFDYKEQKIIYVCRNKSCEHENVFDFATWKKQQKHSPLPKIGLM